MTVETEHSIPQRTSLSVYIRGRRVLRVLRHYGHIQYVSRRANYVILYVNQAQVAEIKPEIEKLHDVYRVLPSPWSTVDPTISSVAETGIVPSTEEE